MLKVTKAELHGTWVHKKDFPVDGAPEIAFAGRSNVGKSSLINTLINRRGLARTSSRPGKTQTINFYRINDLFYLVDLPGYGFAKVPQSVKAQWGKMIEAYLKERFPLKAVVLLVDIRHEPTADDVQMYRWLAAFGITTYIAATKADKISRGRWPSHIKAIRGKLGLASGTEVIPFSADNGEGKEKILGIIEGLLNNEKKEAKK